MTRTATVLKPAVATRRPASIGPWYYLCRTCRGTGEVSAPKAEKMAGGAHQKAVIIPPTSARYRGPKCPRCNGIGLELR